MRKNAITALCLSAAIAVAGCAQGQGPGTKESVGTLGGAALGGLLGSQIGGGTGKLAFTAAGVFLGGLLGNQIGKSLDRADRLEAQQAMGRAQAAPIGETIAWKNAESGNSGTYTPVREGTSSSGKYCREFQQTITVGGKTEQGYGTACRQPDGSWKIVKDG